MNYSQKYSGQVPEDYSKSNHLLVEMKRHGTTCQCLFVCVNGWGERNHHWYSVCAADEHNKYRKNGVAGKTGVKWTSRDLRKGRKESDRSIMELENPWKEA